MTKMRCPACRLEVPANSIYCLACGQAIAENTPTQRLATPSAPRSVRHGEVKHSPASVSSIDDARFIPGTILAGRYRIIGLLGKGGMGEVYRADDLKLSQPVALKFLPARLLNDAASLARFHREVRVARRVSHKNVCRVYDIGEVDGQHFLTMEFIKGEELSSLLRRIGHLPSDKASQIARQLCAGLAAAHDCGILHRDLKPANVMIDEDGNARITDFGLAGLAEEFVENEISAGTPAYMAPEQLDGQGPTVRSDIYSLGLVLYELFTGKKAFAATTLNELLKLRRSDTTPTTPTSIVKDLDPVIEHVIDRCMQKDPAQRPASALQVAAALPGGDPLAAALAAGETPSPEMVAAAPREGALKPAVALACFAGLVATLSFLIVLSSRVRAERMVPLEKPSEVLAANARDTLKSLGFAMASHSFYSFDRDNTFLRAIPSEHTREWERIKTGQPPVIKFWYRQSPRYLVPFSSTTVSLRDPPLDVSGMTTVVLDTRGRLLSLEHQPPQLEEELVSGSSNASSTTNWPTIFAAAGLDQQQFRSTTPRWVPRMFADERVAWEGPHPDHPDLPVRIEAAAYSHRPVHFKVLFPWDRPSRQEEEQLSSNERAAAIILAVLFFIVLLGAAFLGRRNLLLGRSDIKGAFRLALFIFLVSELGLLIGARHVPVLSSELELVFKITSFALFPAALLWLMYIALEPHVRRRWPHLIISWSRLMAGEFRDPMVGRDWLIGGLLGVAHIGIIFLGVFLPQLFGNNPRPISGVWAASFTGLRDLLAIFLGDHIVISVFTGLGFLFLLLLFYILLRRQWLAAAAFWLMAAAVEILAFGVSGPKLYWLASIAIATILTIGVVRFGLLTMIASQFYFFLSMMYPVTLNPSAWYLQSALFPLLIMLGLGGYAFYTSLGGQSIFKGSLLRE